MLPDGSSGCRRCWWHRDLPASILLGMLVRGTPRWGDPKFGSWGGREDGVGRLGVGLGVPSGPCRYLLSGGDGDPPDAVHVGRVSIGELGRGEVALAVLERLPAGCEKGEVGIRPQLGPGEPPQRRDGHPRDQPLHPFRPPTPNSHPAKPPRRRGPEGRRRSRRWLATLPAPRHKPRPPGNHLGGPPHALPRRGGPARSPGSEQVCAAGPGPALPSGSHMVPRPPRQARPPPITSGLGGGAPGV